jgi:hypothetical protein
MQKQLDSDREIKRGKWEIFATAPNRKRSIIGFGLMFGNQFTVSIPYSAQKAAGALDFNCLNEISDLVQVDLVISECQLDSCPSSDLITDFN